MFHVFLDLLYIALKDFIGLDVIHKYMLKTQSYEMKSTDQCLHLSEKIKNKIVSICELTYELFQSSSNSNLQTFFHQKDNNGNDIFETVCL